MTFVNWQVTKMVAINPSTLILIVTPLWSWVGGYYPLKAHGWSSFLRKIFLIFWGKCDRSALWWYFEKWIWVYHIIFASPWNSWPTSQPVNGFVNKIIIFMEIVDFQSLLILLLEMFFSYYTQNKLKGYYDLKLFEYQFLKYWNNSYEI